MNDAITRKVKAYERALLAVLRGRVREGATAPITDEEHQLAAQMAEAVTAYELGLRERRAPPERAPTVDKGPPAQRAVPAGRTTPRPATGTRGRPKGRRGGRRAAKVQAAAKEETE